MKTYAEYVLPYYKKGVTPVIVLSPAKKKKVNEFIVRLAEEKRKEQVHQEDGLRHAKRFYTGFAGEAALEQLFGVEFMDTTVGESEKYRGSDLKGIGLDVGIKTGRFENNKFPLINKNISKPQVMSFLYGEDKVIVFGLATVDTLRTYSDDSMVLDRNAAARKTGFYGFHKLQPFSDLAGLKALVSS